jgi:hypothetical protein
VSSEQKVKVSIDTELPASICYAHSPKHLEQGRSRSSRSRLLNCPVLD